MRELFLLVQNSSQLDLVPELFLVESRTLHFPLFWNDRKYALDQSLPLVCQLQALSQGVRNAVLVAVVHAVEQVVAQAVLVLHQLAVQQEFEARIISLRQLLGTDQALELSETIFWVNEPAARL